MRLSDKTVQACPFMYENLRDLVSSQHLCLQQVIPKTEILRLGVLEQSKEEVIVQVGPNVTQHFEGNQ